MTVYITYSNKEDIKKVRENNSLTFHFIDSLSNKGKKEARTLKSHWAAKLDPFILVIDGDKPIKAFYSEASNDVIEDLNKWIN